jgi:HEAT repeat protein
MAETAYQVSFNAIPGERRDQARAFLSAVPGQAGVVLSGIILVIGEKALTPQQLVWIGLICAVLSLIIQWQSSRAYKLALVDALRSGQPHVFSDEEEPFGGFRNDASSLPVILSGLEDPAPGIRRLSAEILQQLAPPQAASALLKATRDPDLEVRLAAMKALAATDAPLALHEATGWLDDPQPEVRCQAIDSLIQDTAPEAAVLDRIHRLRDDPVPVVRAHTAVALARLGDAESAHAILICLARDPEAGTRVIALRALGKCWISANPPDTRFLQGVAAGLGDAQASVRRVAAEALPNPPPELVQPLIQNLGDDDGPSRQAAAMALGRLGAAAQESLLSALEDLCLERGALLGLGYLPGKPPVEALRAYARRNVTQSVRYQDLAASLAREAHVPAASATADTGYAAGERARLLSDSLLAKARQHALNAFSALGLITDRGSVALSIENLNSSDRSQRAYAMETLDGLNEPQLVRPLLPLWEPDGRGPTQPDVSWRDILCDPDAWLRACSAFYARDRMDDQTIPLLEQIAQSDPDELVRQTAAWTLEGDQPMDTLQTIPTMERVLFLQRVRLFANLTPVDLKQIAAVTRERLFQDGETIALKGEPGDEMYIITSGEVRVLSESGVELARRQPGDFVGEMAIISQQPRMATMVAIGQVRTLCIGQKQFEGILRERFEISLAVMRELGERLRQSSDRRVV